jgi:hypothetical protein
MVSHFLFPLMSKRARPDGPERAVPGFLKKSGLDDHALRQLMDWMDDQDLCFFPRRELEGPHTPFTHAVDPLRILATFNSMAIVCETCGENCECCGEVNIDIKDDDRLHSPHTRVCGDCSKLDCDHADEPHQWPSYCDGCERGCRDVDERTVGGKKQVICDRCRPDEF